MDKELTLEQANDMLEEAIKKLENEALPMEESVALYTHACELLSFCMETINGYKGTIASANEKLAQYNTEETNE